MSSHIAEVILQPHSLTLPIQYTEPRRASRLVALPGRRQRAMRGIASTERFGTPHSQSTNRYYVFHTITHTKAKD